MEANFDDAFKTRPYPAHAGQENAVAPGPTQAYADPAGISVVAGIRELRGKKSVSSLSFSAGDRIELNSIGYEVCDVISGAGKSAEAAIYRIRNSEGNTFALKLYYEFTDSSLEPSADTLQRIREISGGEILNLYDFGTGPNKYLNRYCFEVSEFARGGDLVSVEHFRKKFTPGFIEDVVVSGIFRGIERLHSQRIYHCDLKPQNVFFLDAEQTRVVIGDYGSAKSFDKSNAKELNYTTLTKGTEFYLAPEQAF
ncbi:MAG: protein kinase domain-containing protein, partial [Bacteroidales bacterium]